MKKLKMIIIIVMNRFRLNKRYSYSHFFLPGVVGLALGLGGYRLTHLLDNDNQYKLFNRQKNDFLYLTSNRQLKMYPINKKQENK